LTISEQIDRLEKQMAATVILAIITIGIPFILLGFMFSFIVFTIKIGNSFFEDIWKWAKNGYSEAKN
jgi:uncharacterized membrane protein (DUF485 family)